MLSQGLEKKYIKKLKLLSLSDLKVVKELASEDEVTWANKLAELKITNVGSDKDVIFVENNMNHWNDVANLALQEIEDRMSFFYDLKEIRNR